MREHFNTDGNETSVSDNLNSDVEDHAKIESSIDAEVDTVTTKLLKSTGEDYNDGSSSQDEFDVDDHVKIDSSIDEEARAVIINLLKTNDEDGSSSSDDSAGFSVPTDHGWAWMVLLAATVLYIIVVGYMKCRGILFVQWQHRFGTSASATAVISMLQAVTCSISSLIVMTVGMRYMTCRTSVMIGAAVGGSTYLVTAFATDIRLVYLSDGVAYGVAISFMIPAVLTTINMYFKRYRGLANSIALSGVGIGGLSLAPVFTTLFAQYGYTGTFMIAAGIMYNVIACGALLRPPEKCRDKKTAVQETDAEAHVGRGVVPSDTSDIEVVCSNTGPANGDISADGVSPRVHVALNNNMNTDTMLSNLSSENGLLLNDISSEIDSENITVTDTLFIETSYTVSSPTHNSTDENITTSVDENNMDGKHLTLTKRTLVRFESQQSEIINTKEAPHGRISCAYSRIQSLRVTLMRAVSIGLEFRLLKNPVFRVYLVMTAFLCSGNSLVGDFLAPHAKDMGVTDDRIAILLSVSCGLDVVSKLFFGYISDKNWIRRSTLVAVASVAMGIAAHMMRFMTTFETIMIFAVAIGILQGIYFAQFPAVIIEHLSLDDLTGALGFTFLLQGFATGTSHPIVGALRDITGSYAVTYHYLGLLLFVGAGLCACLPVIQRWKDRRDKHVQ